MGDKGSLILMIVVLVLLVAMFVVSYVQKKKYNSKLNTMREELKIGDRVMIDTGVVGELVDTYEEEGYKYYVLKSGKGNHVGYFAVHANAIYYVFGKDKQLDKIKNVQNDDAKTTEQKEVKENTQQQVADQDTQTETVVDGKPVTQKAKKKNEN